MAITKSTVLTFFVAIALTFFAFSTEAKPFNCALARIQRKCRGPKFAVNGCMWCEGKCSHHSECDSAKPSCEKRRARSRKQKIICKAQGCDVVGKKCVSPSSDGAQPTPPPTTPPTPCKHRVKVVKGKVDKSGYCTKKCPCDAYLGDCDSDADCKGDLVCAKSRGADFGLEEDFDVCMSKDEAAKSDENDDDEAIDEGEQDVEAEKDLPSLEDVVKNPKLILKLPKETLELLGDDLNKVKKDPASILPTTNAKIFATRPPVDVELTDWPAKVKCKRTKKLGELGYCQTSLLCKCGEGEGWCRSDEECQKGLVCQEKQGKAYGFGASASVCVRDESRPSLWEDSGKFEGDIDIETSRFGINQIADRYGMEAAKDIVNAFPKSYFQGAVVEPDHYNPTMPPIDLPDGYNPTRPPITVDPDVFTKTLDIKRPGNLRQLSRKRGLGATDQNILWPDGIVYYTIASSVTEARRNVIQDAMDHWTENSCITFVERTTEADYVEFIQPASGCSSPVGRQGGKQNIRLSQGCSFGSAVHEIMHTLGFWHEQSRPDRDSWIDIDLDKVQAGKTHNFDKKPHNEVDDMGSNYDYGSIMHYGPTAFSVDGSPTIIPKVEGAVIGQRVALSDHDIWQVRKLYGCDTTSCPAGHYSKFKWYGTGPFCSGQCPATSTQVASSRFHGAFCFTGTKKKCKSCCRLTARTEERWFGTAPFCDGECPVGWTQVRRSVFGDGPRWAPCLTGRKVKCRRTTYGEVCRKPDQVYDASCPPGGEHKWFGTAPFCGFGVCPMGWSPVKHSTKGDGATCLIGLKVLCKRDCEA